MPKPVPDGATLYDHVFACIAQVPPGRVTTYGRVGHLVGCPARVVGYALHYLRLLDRPDVPWQRVVNAHGSISTHGDRQRQLLEQEGVRFEEDGTIELRRYVWPDTENIEHRT